MLALEIFGWVILLYGALSLVRDIVNECTYKKINNNMRIYITLKNVEENLEYFIREIYEIKRKNILKNITIVNLDSNIDENIKEKLKEEELDFITIDQIKEKIKTDNF